MARATYRLNLRVLTQRQGRIVWERLVEEGFLLKNGLPGSKLLVEGGFARAHLVELAGISFISCGSRFAALCPATRQNITMLFSGALSRWRAGAGFFLDCSCGQQHPLYTLLFEPDAGFSESYLELRDCNSITVLPEAALQTFKNLVHRG
jgi:hypothetical protein